MKTNFRNAITIPEKSWSRFRDIFSDYVDKMKEGGGGGSGAASGSGPSGGVQQSSSSADIPLTSSSTAAPTSEK